MKKIILLTFVIGLTLIYTSIVLARACEGLDCRATPRPTLTATRFLINTPTATPTVQAEHLIINNLPTSVYTPADRIHIHQTLDPAIALTANALDTQYAPPTPTLSSAYP